MVVPDGHDVGVVEQDVGGHQRRVREEPGAYRRVAPPLVLELRHAGELAEGDRALEEPGESGVLGHVALDEEGADVRVQATGQQRGRQLEGPALEDRRVVRQGEGVEVGDEEERVVLVLRPRPVRERAQVVPEMGAAGRLDPGEDATHGASC